MLARNKLKQRGTSMKSVQRTAAALAALIMIVATSGAHAQVVGGWSAASVKDAEVVAAAHFAIEEHGKSEPVTLKKLVRARQQVVAGMNYRITMLVKRGKRTRKVTAVVWKKTDNTYQLTSWK
jgi:hypothetical protein